MSRARQLQQQEATTKKTELTFVQINCETKMLTFIFLILFLVHLLELTIRKRKIMRTFYVQFSYLKKCKIIRTFYVHFAFRKMFDFKVGKRVTEILAPLV